MTRPIDDPDGPQDFALRGPADRTADAAPTRRLREVIRGFVDPLPLVVYVAAADRPQLRFVSAGIERLLGYSPQEWRSSHALRVDRLHPEDRYRVLQERAESRTEARTFSSEYRLLARGGRTVWVRDEATLMQDEHGVIVDGEPASHWWGLILDLTDQRLAEQELRVVAAQQSALAVLSQRALVTNERQALLDEATGIVAEALGMDRAFVVQRSRPDLPLVVSAATISDVEREVVPGSIAHDALETPGVLTVTDRRHAPDEPRPVHGEAAASAAVAVECPGRVAAALAVESDRPRVFTRDDRALLQSFADVLANALNRFATEAQLGQAMKLNALGRLSAGIAHDFNNILGAVTGFSTLLEPSVRDDPGAAGYLTELQDASQRAAALIDQLLAFSREQPVASVPVDLDELVAGMEGMLSQLVGSQIRLAHERSPHRTVVQGDRHQLEQVLMNLVVNARDAMPEGGTVTVRVRLVGPEQLAEELVDLPPTNHVALEVEDEGMGMDAATQEQVFEPFFTTKPASEGTGLGLSTVLGIVQRHGGVAAVDSEVDRGTRFVIYLPEAAELPAAGTPAPAKAHGDAALAGEAVATIAVVDDQQAIRTVVDELLTMQGYIVIAESDAQDCLAALAEHPEVDLLLTDVSMPGLTGPKLAQEIWRTRPGLPVIYMSGYGPAADVEPGKSRGPVYRLTKPFSAQDLLDVVATALDPGPGRAG